MELLISNLISVAGKEPQNGIDEYGNTYSDFSLTNEAYFSFVVPSVYVEGEDISLVMTESSPAASKVHKWLVTSTIALSYTQDQYASFTSALSVGSQSTRTIPISTSGKIGNHTIQAGATVNVSLTRTDADSDEDSNKIRIYSVLVTFASSDVVTSSCLGRVGNVVTGVLMVLNDDKQRFINQYEIVAWINEAILEIAMQGYWKKQTLVDVVAAQESYYLPTLIPDLERIEAVRWHEPSASGQYRDKMIMIGTWQNYQDLLYQVPTAARAYRYFLQGDYLYPTPVPSRDLSEGIAIYHSYCPSSVGCTSNTDLPVPKAHDDLFKWYALVMAYGRDRHSPMAAQSQQMYMGLLRGAMARLMSNLIPPGTRLRSNR